MTCFPAESGRSPTSSTGRRSCARQRRGTHSYYRRKLRRTINAAATNGVFVDRAARSSRRPSSRSTSGQGYLLDPCLGGTRNAWRHHGGPTAAFCNRGEQPHRPSEAISVRHRPHLETAPYCEAGLRGATEPLRCDGEEVEVYVQTSRNGQLYSPRQRVTRAKPPFRRRRWQAALPYRSTSPTSNLHRTLPHQPRPCIRSSRRQVRPVQLRAAKGGFIPPAVDPAPYYHRTSNSDGVMFNTARQLPARKVSGIARSFSPSSYGAIPIGHSPVSLRKHRRRPRR